MMQKILTISIAAYNVENYIEEALNPFTDLNIVDRIEVLIIDDGGTDATLSIAKRYQEKYPNTFKLVHKDNGGWGSTVNYGIQHATGRYFKQLDGDDFFSADVMEQYLELLNETNCDLIYTSFRTFEDGSNKTLTISRLPDDIPRNQIVCIDTIPKNIPLNMHSCTFKTSILKDNVSILEHCFYTDVEYTLKALANVYTVLFSDLEIYQYRIGRAGQSMSLYGFRKHYKEHEKVLVTLLEFQQNLLDSCSSKSFIQERIHQMIDNQYMIFLYLEPTREHKTEMVQFDKFLNRDYKEYYSTELTYIKLLRALNFSGYYLAAKCATRRLERI